MTNVIVVVEKETEKYEVYVGNYSYTSKPGYHGIILNDVKDDDNTDYYSMDRYDVYVGVKQ
jgi:hypothetical protein